MAVQSFRHWLAIAVLTCLSTAGAGHGFAQNLNLVVNPVFARDMPVPGWIGNHRDDWVRVHPVYHAGCQNAEVMGEIRFLNRVIAYDEYLLSLTTATDPDNPMVDHLANVARQSAVSLRRDISTVDALVAQLRLLPRCDGDGAEKAAKVSTLPAQPMRETGPAPAPAPPASAPPAAEPPSPAATAPSAAKDPPVDATETAERARIVIRFDNRLAALTPSGIRAFDGAVNALRAGKTVQLAIEGCEPGADFSNGTPCARRLATLRQMLADNGIRDARKPLAEIR
jgi:hypothetical protein